MVAYASDGTEREAGRFRCRGLAAHEGVTDCVHEVVVAFDRLSEPSRFALIVGRPGVVPNLIAEVRQVVKDEQSAGANYGSDPLDSWHHGVVGRLHSIDVTDPGARERAACRLDQVLASRIAKNRHDAIAAFAAALDGQVDDLGWQSLALVINIQLVNDVGDIRVSFVGNPTTAVRSAPPQSNATVTW